MDTERLVVLATVGVAAGAGEAALAVDVRLDGATVAGPNVGHTRADGDDLDAEFVAGDARVGEERHLAEVAAQVGAADADAVDAHQRVAGAGFGRLGEVDALPLFRRFELQGFHGWLV